MDVIKLNDTTMKCPKCGEIWMNNGFTTSLEEPRFTPKCTKCGYVFE